MTLRKAILAASALLALWVVVDLARPVSLHLRRFDPHEVARIETGMWRDYYEHRPVRLFGLLGELLRRQYGLPFWRSWLGAYYAAHSAVTFQKGHNRSDYERALPDLRRYYALIRRGSDIPFDTDRVAASELEWWIAHRERRPDLVRTLAVLQSDIFGLPPERFQEHAAARARAMLPRDEKADAISDEDWRQIERWLDDSWSSLHAAIQ